MGTQIHAQINWFWLWATVNVCFEEKEGVTTVARVTSERGVSQSNQEVDWVGEGSCE